MKFKKIVVSLLVLCMIVPALPQRSVLGSNITKDAQDLQVNNMIEGFRVVSKEYNKESQSDVYEFVHLKTGAKVLWFKNDDMNRTFAIGFNTPAENDKGINHILEHTVIGGSEKYPATNLFFDMANNTYTSFINAFTSQNMTIFPVASMSEAQLLKSADVYLDSVFHPLVMKDKKYFEREAWRYELESVDADLTYGGTVYNEMKSYEGDMMTSAMVNRSKAIFGQTDQATQSGGIPKDILTLTYEEYCDTYKKNYHPSNCLVTLYGDINCSDFLRLMNEDYFSEYTKVDRVIEHNTVPEYEGIKKSVFSFPVTKQTETKQSSIIDYCFTLDDMKNISLDEFATLSLASSLLSLDNSILKTRLTESKIAESYNVSLGTDKFQPIFSITAVNADENRADEFVQVIDQAIAETIKAGLKTDLIKSIIRSMKMGEVVDSGGYKGVNTCLNAQIYSSMFGDGNTDFNTCLYGLESKLDEGILEKALSKFVQNNKRKALVITKKEKGLTEVNEKQLKKQLQDIKKSMTEEELKALVQKTMEFAAFNGQTTSPEVLESLKGITVSELPEEVESYNINNAVVDGAKLLSTTAMINDVNISVLNFDLSHLNEEELLYAKFYSQMLVSGVATETRSEEAVISDMVSKTYSLQMSINPFTKNGVNIVPSYMVGFFATNDSYQESLDSIYDLLFNVNIEKSDTYIQRTITSTKAAYTSELGSPFTEAQLASAASASEAGKLNSYLLGFDYYDFILKLEKDYAKNPKAVMQKITAVKEKLFNKNCLTVEFAGDSEGIQKINASMKGLIAKLPKSDAPIYKLNLPTHAKREGWIANTGASHVCFASDVNQFTTNPGVKLTPIMMMLDSIYLTPSIRYNGSAYSVYAAVDQDLMQCGSYVDGDIATTTKTIYGIPAFMNSVKGMITDANLENFILATYSNQTVKTSPLVSAINAVDDYQRGVTPEDKLQVLKDLKSVTTADLDEYIAIMNKLVDTGSYVIVGPRSAIEGNADLFDKVIDLTEKYK